MIEVHQFKKENSP